MGKGKRRVYHLFSHLCNELSDDAVCGCYKSELSVEGISGVFILTIQLKNMEANGMKRGGTYLNLF